MSLALLAVAAAVLVALACIERRCFLLGSFIWRRRFRDICERVPSVAVRASGPGELREMFDFVTARIGGRCNYDHPLEAVIRNEHGRQVLSCRIRTGPTQYHFRVMPVPGGYAVTGHYELAPERHPLRHYIGAGADFARALDDFQKLYGEWQNLRGGAEESAQVGAR